MNLSEGRSELSPTSNAIERKIKQLMSSDMDYRLIKKGIISFRYLLLQHTEYLAAEFAVTASSKTCPLRRRSVTFKTFFPFCEHS